MMTAAADGSRTGEARADDAQASSACTICETRVSDPGLLADCSGCGALFHLNPRNDIEGIDCGDVWVGDCDEPVLQFFCDPCLARIRAAMAAQPLQPPAAGFGAPPAGLGAPMPAPAPPAPSAPPPPAPPPARADAARTRRRFRRIDGA